MPSAVLLAILVGVGVLVLTPAMLRRYDNAAKVRRERDSGFARVLDRNARRRRRHGHRTPTADPALEPLPATTLQAPPRVNPQRNQLARRRTVAIAGATVSLATAGSGAVFGLVNYGIGAVLLVATIGYLAASRPKPQSHPVAHSAPKPVRQRPPIRSATPPTNPETRTVAPPKTPYIEPPDEETLGRVANL